MTVDSKAPETEPESVANDLKLKMKIVEGLAREQVSEEEEDEVESTTTAAGEEAANAKKKKKNKKKKKKNANSGSGASAVKALVQQTEPPSIPVSKMYINEIYPGMLFVLS